MWTDVCVTQPLNINIICGCKCRIQPLCGIQRLLSNEGEQHLQSYENIIVEVSHKLHNKQRLICTCICIQQSFGYVYRILDNVEVQVRQMYVNAHACYLHLLCGHAVNQWKMTNYTKLLKYNS